MKKSFEYQKSTLVFLTRDSGLTYKQIVFYDKPSIEKKMIILDPKKTVTEKTSVIL